MIRNTGILETTGGKVETLWIPPRTENTGLTLVLLHEGLGCIELWRDFPQQLAHRTGLGVFAYSRVGYGRSDPCDLPRPLTYMHHEAQSSLPEILETLPVPSIILLGHSDGASIATIHAGSTVDHRLRGIILIAPHFFVETVAIDSIQAARMAYQTGQLRDRLSAFHGDNVDGAFRGWNDAWLDPEFQHWDLTGFLPHIRLPVLFIQGKEDPYGTLRQLDVLRQTLPSPPEVNIVDHCGHSPHLEQPDQTLESIIRFLRQFNLPSL